MSTLDIAGSTVGYEQVGEGPALLVIHGTTMNRSGWDFVLAALPDEYCVVKVDLPGSGESSVPDGDLSVDGVVAGLVGLMDRLGHERFHVAGYSLGAVLAAAVAGTVPDRVLSATMLCGWAVTDARQRLTFDVWKRLIAVDPALFMRYAFADGFTAGALAAMEPMLEAMVPMAAATVAPGSHLHLDLDIAVDISALLAKITAPTLVIGAEQDRWVDVSHSRALADSIAGARLVTLPAGHLVIQEMAGDVAALLHEHASA